MGRTDSVRDHSEILLVFFDANTESLRGYDVSTKNWNGMQSYAAEMKKWNFTALVLNEYIYVLLANKAVYRLKYAVHDSCWTRMPDMTSDHGQYPPATVFKGSIHVHGTAGAGFPSASGERFDPAQNQWHTIADMKTERRSHAIASTSDAVYCIGGQNTEGEIGSVERFSLNTDTWTYCAPMSRPRHSAAAVELSNKIYVICGWTSHNRLCDVEIYDPASDAWSAVQATNVPRALPKACVVGGQLMVVGGDESRTETMENYSQHQKSWTIKALPDMRIDSAVSISNAVRLLGIRTDVAKNQAMSQGNQDYQANAGVEDVPGTSRDMGHASRDIHGSHIQNVIMGDNISIHQSDVREESGDKASKIPKLQDLDDPVHLSHEFYIDRQEPLSTHSAVYQGIRKSDAMGPVTVAIKQIPINIQEDAGTLLNEAKSIIGINHRNVIKYIHADYCKGTFSSMYLAMELCLSENMHDRVVRMRRSNRRFTRPDCMSVAKQLAAGLKAVHDKNLLHRDIKPSNVLISLDRKCIKLTDFSLAKPKLPDRSVTADSSKRIGTDGWRAPEVLKHNSHRFESDIFSLGLVFYFVWSNGDHAFGQDSDLTNANIKNNKNRNLQKIQFPEAEMAETLLTKMLEYDARRRISAVDLCSDPLLVVATDELENLDGCPCSGVTEPEIAPLTGESIILFSKTSSLMHAYIPSRNVWEHRQPLSQDIVSWEMTVVALGAYIYTLLQNQRVYRIKYNDPNAHWEQQKNTVYDHGGMPSAAVLEGRIYVIGGSQWSTKITKEGEVYEPNGDGGTWSKIPDMTTSRKVHSLVSCKGCIYSIGGWERIGSGEEGAVAKCEKFDPNAGGHGSWSSIPSMHKIRYATATVAHDEKIYVLGGWREGCRLTEAECYDVNRNTWTILKDMSTGRSFFSAVAVGGRVYAIDGDDVAPQTIEEYDPERKEWKMVAKLDNMQIWPKGAVSAVLQPEPIMEGTSR